MRAQTAQVVKVPVLRAADLCPEGVSPAGEASPEEAFPGETFPVEAFPVEAFPEEAFPVRDKVSYSEEAHWAAYKAAPEASEVSAARSDYRRFRVLPDHPA